MKKEKILGILLVILVLGVAVYLRLLGIDCPLWYDEACSWFSAKRDFPFGIMDNLLHLDLQHTPLYFFLLHFWMKIFGESEVALRCLSLIFGIATVPMAYVVSRKLVSKTVAFLAAAIVAVSPILVFFSVEVRMYPVAVFLVLLSLNYFIDFEQKNNDTKSLIKLVITNLLIPYTLVGGIFYNVALAVCYGQYLFQNNKEKFALYKKGLLAEFLLLIPYFIQIGYYAKMRSVFVIRHEGALAFSQVFEAIRNFFGITLVDNLYWPAVNSYVVNFAFAMLVIVPCVYFIYGIAQCRRNSNPLIRCLFALTLLAFGLAIVVALFQVNIFTVRYILYLLPPMLILGIIGLSDKISLIHLKIFTAFFAISSIVFLINYIPHSKELKQLAFKAVAQEAKELKLGADDIVIMPFGADAPYYFRLSDTPRVFDFDFHKQVRNPYNDKIYDKSQQNRLATEARYSLIYDMVFVDRVFSDSFYKYFMQNVNNKVEPGRYVLIAFFGTDANSLVSLQQLRTSVTSIRDVQDRPVDILLKKFTYDMRAMLFNDFDEIKTYPKDNYTYMLLQKR